jgi:hypothetical protein
VLRSVRGGQWDDIAALAGSAIRSDLEESSAAPGTGFRCAASM